ncbi:MAG: type II toxin-antitoxin system VapC family toxin [Treponema sp.]|nr:type II toxin-antitoxin system VapC family toxin [Treponema sp.]
MTNFLLDTNVFLWYFWGTEEIKVIKQLIESSETNIYVSTASWWEIAIKKRTGKLTIDLEQLRYHVEKHAFSELPITSKYMKAYLELPNLHKDPFDHLLLAQAISCPMRLITGDAILAEYSSLVMVI